MKTFIVFCVCIAIVASAAVEPAKKEVASKDKKQDKRGLYDFGYGFDHGLHGFDHGLSSLDLHGGYHGGLELYDHHGLEKQVTITKTVGIPQPYAVPVEKHVPYPVKVPVAYPVDKPYPVYIEKKVPYYVEKHVPVHVDRPVPYAVKVPVEVPVIHKVAVPVPKPYAVEVPKPYPVHISHPVVIEKHGWEHGHGYHGLSHSYSDISLHHH